MRTFHVIHQQNVTLPKMDFICNKTVGTCRTVRAFTTATIVPMTWNPLSLYLLLSTALLCREHHFALRENVSLNCSCFWFLSLAEQWKPIDPEQKKHYDREFLLGFQFSSASMSKPEGLPAISDVVLDKVPHLAMKTFHSIFGFSEL